MGSFNLKLKNTAFQKLFLFVQFVKVQNIGSEI
jgi:hypothetical protein